MRNLFWVILLSFFVLSLSLHADEFRFLTEAKIVEEYYPEPIDKLLNKMVTFEDQVVVLFREICVAQNKSQNGKNYLFTQVSKAVKDHHKLMCSALKKKIMSKGPDYFSKKLEKYWHSILPEDRAAFHQLFQIIPQTNLQNVQNLVSTAAEEQNKLKEPENLSNYIQKISANPNFYKKIPFASLFNETIDKWDILINKVKYKFALSDIIRCVEKAQRLVVNGELKIKIGLFKARVIQKLTDDIELEFMGLIEDKLCEETITLIALQANNTYIFKTSLLKGRLRCFVKKLQTLTSDNERNLFKDILKIVASKIETLGKVVQDAESSRYIKMVGDTLNLNLLLLNSMKFQNEPIDNQKLFKDIARNISEEDEEKALVGIDKLF